MGILYISSVLMTQFLIVCYKLKPVINCCRTPYCFETWQKMRASFGKSIKLPWIYVFNIKYIVIRFIWPGSNWLLIQNNCYVMYLALRWSSVTRSNFLICKLNLIISFILDYVVFSEKIFVHINWLIIIILLFLATYM